MKKIIAVILLTALTLSVAVGCTEKNNKTTDSSDSATLQTSEKSESSKKNTSDNTDVTAPVSDTHTETEKTDPVTEITTEVITESVPAETSAKVETTAKAETTAKPKETKKPEKTDDIDMSKLLKEITVLESDSVFVAPVLNGTELNVKDFGAKGDGKTNDSAAIIAAVQKAKDVGGGTVYFPDGKYIIKEKITFGTELILAFSDSAWISSSADLNIKSQIVAGNHNLFEGSGVYTLKIRNTIVNPVWFGARADGNTNDTEAFKTAIAQNGEIYIPYSENGYAVGNISISKSIRLKGIPSGNKRPKLIGDKDADYIFRFVANGIQMDSLDVEMSKTGKAPVFYYDTSSVGRDDYILRDIDVYGAYCVVNDAGVVTNYVTNSLIDNVNCYDCRNTALDLKCFWGFIFFRNLTIDISKSNSKYGVSTNFPLVKLANNAGCVFQNMTLIGDGSASKSQQIGFSYSNNVATWMDGCIFKNFGSSAVRVAGGSNSYLYFSNLTASGCKGDTFDFNGISYGLFNNITITDGNKAGIVLNSCRYAAISECKIEKVTNGIFMNACMGSTVANSEIKNCSAFGVISSNGMGNSCSGCNVIGNASGNYKDIKNF